jgi:hypothetical protein
MVLYTLPEGAVKSVPEVFMKKKVNVKKSAEVLALEQENRRLKVRLAHVEMAAKEVRKNFDTQ